MAKAIINGLYKDYELEVVGRDLSRLQTISDEFKIKHYLLNGFNIDNKNILLCVKPFALSDVAKELKGCANTLISILAGVKLEKLQIIKSINYARAMPNLSAIYQKSTTAIVADSIQSEDISKEIFNHIGKTVILKSEKEIDIATAIAGSGPAMIALVAEALCDGGVLMGLKRDDSMSLVKGLFSSFAPLIDEIHPTFIKEKVMSPAGTTSKAIYELENSAIRSSFIKAVECATIRANEIGKG